jgi:hypothetical protein
MKYKSWVCTVCSQDFTRKFSAYRHLWNLHKGQAKAVRTLDYIVGRISGEYQAANPSAYRSQNKQHESTGPFSNAVSAGSFPFVSVAHNSSEKSSTTTTRFPNEDHETNQRASLNSAQQLAADLDNNSFKLKFRAFIKSYRDHYPTPATEVDLNNLALRIIKDGGNEAILNECRQKLQNQMNINEAMNFLSDNLSNEARNTSRAPLHNHHVKHLPESSRVLLAQIEQILMETEGELIMWEKIQNLIRRCESTTDHSFLNEDLESCRRSSSAYGLSQRRQENKSGVSPQVANLRNQSYSEPLQEVKSSGYDTTYFKNVYQEHSPPFSKIDRSSPQERLERKNKQEQDTLSGVLNLDIGSLVNAAYVDPLFRRQTN